MKTTSTLITFLAGLILMAATLALCAQEREAARPPVNREEIRRQLRQLPPDERRALIQELRDQNASQSAKPRREALSRAQREEIMRELKNLPPEERRARIRALRDLPPEKAGQDRPEARRGEQRDLPRAERAQPGVPAAGAAGRFAPMFERVLTEDQRVSFREAMEAQRGHMRELEEKLRDARREALRASVAREFNEGAIRERAWAVAKMEAEMAVIRARALSRVRPPLTADQIERLQNPPLLQGGTPRPELRREEPVRQDRPARGPRDENDLPRRPRAEP